MDSTQLLCLIRVVLRIHWWDFCLAIWFQNSSMYHFSMFHASHHVTPVPATETEVIIYCLQSPISHLYDRSLLTSQVVQISDWSWSSCCKSCCWGYLPTGYCSRSGGFDINWCTTWLLAGNSFFPNDSHAWCWPFFIPRGVYFPRYTSFCVSFCFMQRTC